MIGPLNMVTTCLAAAAFCFGVAGAPSTQAQRPSFVVIVTDDQRADAMGCAANPHIRTPNIDALARSGLRFTNAFVTTSICSPSRAALLTGRYGSANGVRGLANAVLNAGEITWAQALQRAGYRTALIGKWHLENPPDSLGFDQVTFFRSNGPYYGRVVSERGRKWRVDGHLDDYVAEQATRFLREASAQAQPFALLICTQLPHMCPGFRWDAKPETLERYRAEDLPVPASWEDDLADKPAYLKAGRHRIKAVDEYGYDRKEGVQQHVRAYYATITDMDAAIGSVLRAMRDLGLTDHTYVVFTADNGWFLGEHRFTSKVLAYEESIRVPLIIAGPGIRRGTDARLVLNIDIAPTLLELAGLPVSKDVHGASLLPILQSGNDARKVPWRESILYEAMHPELGSWPLLAVRTNRWKYILTFKPDTQPPEPAFEELYDLSTDPGELRNLVRQQEHAKTLREMRAALARERPAVCERR